MRARGKDLRGVPREEVRSAKSSTYRPNGKSESLAAGCGIEKTNECRE